MVIKSEQERVRALLTEAVTVLCKNGLPYKTSICVQGLLGITLDENEVLLIDIRETVRTEIDEMQDIVAGFGVSPEHASTPLGTTSQKRPRGRPSMKRTIKSSPTHSADDSADASRDSEIDGQPATKRLADNSRLVASPTSKRSTRAANGGRAVIKIEDDSDTDVKDEKRSDCRLVSTQGRIPTQTNVDPGCSSWDSSQQSLDFPGFQEQMPTVHSIVPTAESNSGGQIQGYSQSSGDDVQPVGQFGSEGIETTKKNAGDVQEQEQEVAVVKITYGTRRQKKMMGPEGLPSAEQVPSNAKTEGPEKASQANKKNNNPQQQQQHLDTSTAGAAQTTEEPQTDISEQKKETSMPPPMQPPPLSSPTQLAEQSSPKAASSGRVLVKPPVVLPIGAVPLVKTSNVVTRPPILYDNPPEKSEDDKYMCHECMLTFETRNELDDHVYENHLPTWYQCGICKKVFIRESNLLKHMMANHDTK